MSKPSKWAKAKYLCAHWLETRCAECRPAVNGIALALDDAREAGIAEGRRLEREEHTP